MSEEDKDDRAVLRFMLNGRNPRYRKEPRRWADRRVESPVTNPDLLDPYERLFYDDDPSRTKEALALCQFHWGERFSYPEAVAWFRIGAGYHDLPTCRMLADNNVTPELAAMPFMFQRRDTGINVLRAVALGRARKRNVIAWARQMELAKQRLRRAG